MNDLYLPNPEISPKYTRFRAVSKGETNYISLVANPLFLGVKVHYKDKFFVCKEGECCEKLGMSRWRVGTVIVHYNDYPIQRHSKYLYNDYTLKPWIFGERMYQQLRDPLVLDGSDLRLKCENEYYQTFAVMSMVNCVWRQSDEIDRIINGSNQVMETMRGMMAHDLTPEQISILLADVAVSPSDSVSGLPANPVPLSGKILQKTQKGSFIEVQKPRKIVWK